MANWKKLASGAAGAAGAGGPLYGDDVFSVDKYTGNSSGTTGTTTITNGINLSGEGGLVFFTPRTQVSHKAWMDTVRGGTKELITTTSTIENTAASGTGVTFNSNGFSTTGSYFYNSNTNTNNQDYVAYTFRKAPNFFDIVEYTGNGSSQTISHNLGTVPGMIIVKARDRAENWAVWHRGLNQSYSAGYRVWLNQDVQQASSTLWGNYNSSTGTNGFLPTSTEFTVGNGTETNNNGTNFIAYIFAHHDGTGTFGENEDEDIISCGYYEGNSNNTGVYVNNEINFEPQFVLIKRVDAGNSDWVVVDDISGAPASYSTAKGTKFTLTNDTQQETNISSGWVDFYPDYFRPAGNNSQINANYGRYIYVAIRRKHKPPSSADEVFDIFTRNGTGSTAKYSSLSFAPDMAIVKGAGNNIEPYFGTRFQYQDFLYLSESYGESGYTNEITRWNGNGVEYGNSANAGLTNNSNSLSHPYVNWMWARRPKFFDVVHWRGTGGSVNLKHNLGVAPEMMWFKNRTRSMDFIAYSTDVGVNAETYLAVNQQHDAGGGPYGNVAYVNATPTATELRSVGADGVGSARLNNNGDDFIAVLFASLAGVSKVGTYTGNGSSQTIDCGFSNGSKFVMVKRTDNDGNWGHVNTLRGINTGNDPTFFFNFAAAENTSFDVIDTASSGFIVNDVGTYWNENGGTYLFYAIAA